MRNVRAVQQNSAVKERETKDNETAEGVAEKMLLELWRDLDVLK